MIDTHCHIQFNSYKDDYEEVIKRCTEKGMILNCVGSQIDTSRRAVEYAEKYENIYATIGLHPVHLFSSEVDEEETKFKTREEKFDYEEYKKLAEHPKVIGIGECGLELFHLPKDANKDEILAKQKEGFLLQYKLAQELALPMVIHVRDAYDEMVEFLTVIARRSTADEAIPSQNGIATPRSGEVRNDICGVVHCYSGNWAQASKFIDLGLYLGFTGILTYPTRKTNPKPTEDLVEVVKNCPIERILIETDAPYLAPQKYRGQRCEPWMVEEVAVKIAEIKGISVEEVREQTVKNALKLFKKLDIWHFHTCPQANLKIPLTKEGFFSKICAFFNKQYSRSIWLFYLLIPRIVNICYLVCALLVILVLQLLFQLFFL
ncbi:MAG: Hydrolase, TatD family [Candidatus Magasanikbacteria bacterium GW2011_GWC2_37_14]|uniref:Hydrolase, TatD family n=1 Tax=Candidatus Magasanikbacteria bacterium GW2011_GWC2_37_14 TaxID=1619046 RepID=A0A0G0IVC1_9BACT|nr:MAG: Hydrolase, TatD family [Candidatus Magasanikbacteria bacterium GW2011_GWC2_37_14]